MAKFELRFIDEFKDYKISINVCELTPDDVNFRKCINISIFNPDETKEIADIILDKSTAIKFAKTLRTEINKITESEVNNG